MLKYQLKASKQQHSDAVTVIKGLQLLQPSMLWNISNIFLDVGQGVGGIIYTPHSIQPGIGLEVGNISNAFQTRLTSNESNALQPWPQSSNAVLKSRLRTILLGVGGTCYIEHFLNPLKQLGLDHQHALKIAHKLHAHSVMYANKLVTT
eukprot:1158047-Pelagomonas_calceolata.AAC.1